jgi:predicted nucleic acid-binding protein
MTVLVDTPVWSFAYRRARRTAREQAVVAELVSLIRREEAVLVGAVRQEVLSGISDAKLFDDVRQTLRGFVELSATTADYEAAAGLHNHCRVNGIQGSPTDFLICAISIKHDAAIFTTDRDFARYAKYSAIRLHTE